MKVLRSSTAVSGASSSLSLSLHVDLINPPLLLLEKVCDSGRNPVGTKTEFELFNLRSCSSAPVRFRVISRIPMSHRSRFSKDLNRFPEMIKAWFALCLLPSAEKEPSTVHLFDKVLVNMRIEGDFNSSLTFTMRQKIFAFPQKADWFSVTACGVSEGQSEGYKDRLSFHSSDVCRL